ncbi:hypothetical protein B4U80_01643, partial [Leptotrombidium deliense]
MSRDEYVTVHEENMYNTVRYNYRKFDKYENELLVPIDFYSIMLYGPYMASKNGLPKMTANDPNQMFIYTYEKE